MNESFKVGDVAIITCSIFKPFPVGTEVTILGPLERDLYGDTHHIGWHKGKKVYAMPSSLRKKQPPPQREATSSWDDLIVWRPKELSRV